MEQCSLFFFLSNNFFHAKNLRFLLLIWFLCGGSESLCQRFLLKLMTYDMGKKVNMGREPCMHERRGTRRRNKFYEGKGGWESPQIIFNSFRNCVSFVCFQLTELSRPRWESNVEHTYISISQVIAKDSANWLKMWFVYSFGPLTESICTFWRVKCCFPCSYTLYSADPPCFAE